ncbi:hypothetical protein AVEN_207276-1 [Araneus ventricosus]|uniref:Uncharacterized protein n=1 Tax=Araneus ventricosus TaxID=182803 RepID=A0A4Y2ID80_ARAVE|nr:hypothetical protein AVEN_207276-1 [Araneus ventricosus]
MLNSDVEGSSFRKPDFIRDPSLQVHVKSDVEGSRLKPDFLLSDPVIGVPGHMLNLTSKVPVRNPGLSSDRLCVEPVHVKSESKVPDSKPRFTSEIRLVLKPGTVKSTSKVSDSKPYYIRDPSCIEPEIRLVLSQVHVKSDVEVPDSKPDLQRSFSMVPGITVKSDVEGSRFETDFIRDPSCVEPGTVKIRRRRFQIRNLISSEIFLYGARYMLIGRRRFQIRNPFTRDPSYMVPGTCLNLTSKVPDSKPFIRDPLC